LPRSQRSTTQEVVSTDDGQCAVMMGVDLCAGELRGGTFHNPSVAARPFVAGRSFVN
jgi:hypothetical protein